MLSAVAPISRQLTFLSALPEEKGNNPVSRFIETLDELDLMFKGMRWELLKVEHKEELTGYLSSVRDMLSRMRGIRSAIEQKDWNDAVIEEPFSRTYHTMYELESDLKRAVHNKKPFADKSELELLSAMSQYSRQALSRFL